MPNRPSSIKNLRKSKRKAIINQKRIKAMKQIIRLFKKNISVQKFEEASKLLPKLYKTIDKACKGGVIKKNAAARKKSRLTRLLMKQLVKNKQTKA